MHIHTYMVLLILNVHHRGGTDPDLVLKLSTVCFIDQKYMMRTQSYSVIPYKNSHQELHSPK